MCLYTRRAVQARNVRPTIRQCRMSVALASLQLLKELSLPLQLG